jgi:hypothetical protein
MFFTVETHGAEADTSTIKIDGVNLEFLEPGISETMDPEIISKMFSSIDIANIQFYRDSVFQKPAQRFIHYPVTDTINNPLEVRWQTPNIVPLNTIDTMVVMVTIKQNAPNKSFDLALRDVHAFDVDPQLPFKVVDSNDNPLYKSADMITPNSISIISKNPEEAYRTYPNPFGRIQEHANIRFYLEKASDVEIRIFTLVGELVWTRIVKGETRGIHDGRNESVYRWDGRNDRGTKVLNGVYLCVLRANGKSLITKIAYIK